MIHIIKYVYNVAKNACNNFPKKYDLIDILALEVILNTCNNTENPPKPRTNAQKTILRFIFEKDKLQIYDIPFVISKKPVNNPIVKLVGILSKLKKFEIITRKLHDWRIDIIIEKRTTNPPIIKIVLIDVIMLFDNTSPKSQKDNVWVLIEYSELLNFLS